MKVTLKMTLDGLVQALRWRQIDYFENPQSRFHTQDKRHKPSEQGEEHNGQ
jgi:hypothetical protein